MSERILEDANYVGRDNDFLTDPSIFMDLAKELVRIKPLTLSDADMGYGFSRLDHTVYAALLYSTVANPIKSWLDLSRQCRTSIDEAMRSVAKISEWVEVITKVQTADGLGIQDRNLLRDLCTLSQHQLTRLLGELSVDDIRKLHDLAQENKYLKGTVSG